VHLIKTCSSSGAAGGKARDLRNFKCLSPAQCPGSNFGIGSLLFPFHLALPGRQFLAAGV
jgi:hypothetical protein